MNVLSFKIKQILRQYTPKDGVSPFTLGLSMSIDYLKRVNCIGFNIETKGGEGWVVGRGGWWKG